MFQVYSCLTTQHDWRLVLTAAVLCIVGVATTFRLLSQARRTSGRRRANYLMLCGVVCGSALVRLVAAGASPSSLSSFVSELKAATRGCTQNLAFAAEKG